MYEALDYLDQVKLRYADQPEVFVHFLDILDDYKGGTTDYFSVIRRFSTLFADNLDLIEAFNSFNPTGYHIECGADNNYLIVRITTPDGTTIDTKIHLGSERNGRFYSGINGQSTSSSSSGRPETQITSNVEAPRLQMLADLASRPSIAATAREALQTDHQAASPAFQSGAGPSDSFFQPNGGTRSFNPAGPPLRFVQVSGHRAESAWAPRQNYAPVDHPMDDSSGSGSSRESPTSSHKESSTQRKRSYVSMDGVSPVQDKPHSRNVFQMHPTLSGLKGPDSGRKPQLTQSQYFPTKDSSQSVVVNNLPKEESAVNSKERKFSDSKSSRTQEDTKPAKQPRSNKRQQSGQTKSARTHTNRAFPCPFAPYGCPATFGSKNEWKRHINTQHMRLGYWRCDLCDQVRPNDFNRKDLFIQHMRRMHSADNKNKSESKPAAKNDPEEQALAAAANRCWRHIHSPPEQSSCVFCEVKFNGVGTWDERLEHIGRHMELIVKEGEVVDTQRFEKDLALEEWLAREEIIVEGKDGYTLAEGKM